MPSDNDERSPESRPKSVVVNVEALKNLRIPADWLEHLVDVCEIEAALLEGDVAVAAQMRSLYQESTNPTQKGLLAVLLAASRTGAELILQDWPAHLHQQEGALKPLLLYALCRFAPAGAGAARDEENVDWWRRRLAGIAYLIEHNTSENEAQVFASPSDASPSSAVRRAPGLNDFRRQFPEDVRKVLLQALDDAHSEVAGISLRAIRISDDRQLTSEFVFAALSKSDDRLADFLSAVDGSLLTPEAFGSLCRFVQSNSLDSRAVEQAVSVLARQPLADAEKALLNAYQSDPRQQVKVKILGALEKKNTPDVRTLVHAELMNASPCIRTAAVQAISGWGRTDENLSVLRQAALADESPLVRYASLVALTAKQAVGTEDAALLRRISLEDHSPEIRSAAAKALEQTGPPASQSRENSKRP